MAKIGGYVPLRWINVYELCAEWILVGKHWEIIKALTMRKMKIFCKENFEKENHQFLCINRSKWNV